MMIFTLTSQQHCVHSSSSRNVLVITVLSSEKGGISMMPDAKFHYFLKLNTLSHFLLQKSVLSPIFCKFGHPSPHQSSQYHRSSQLSEFCHLLVLNAHPIPPKCVGKCLCTDLLPEFIISPCHLLTFLLISGIPIEKISRLGWLMVFPKNAICEDSLYFLCQLLVSWLHSNYQLVAFKGMLDQFGFFQMSVSDTVL